MKKEILVGILVISLGVSILSLQFAFAKVAMYIDQLAGSVIIQKGSIDYISPLGITLNITTILIGVYMIVKNKKHKNEVNN